MGRVRWRVVDYRLNVSREGQARAIDEAQEAAERVLTEIGRGLTAVRATVWVVDQPGGWNARAGGAAERDGRLRRRRRGYSWERWEPVEL